MDGAPSLRILLGTVINPCLRILFPEALSFWMGERSRSRHGGRRRRLCLDSRGRAAKIRRIEPDPFRDDRRLLSGAGSEEIWRKDLARPFPGNAKSAPL